jgi:multiple sugar transport system permease protein
MKKHSAVLGLVQTAKKTAFAALVLCVSIFILGPIVWLVVSSLVSQSQLISLGRDLRFPTSVTLDAYKNAFGSPEILKGIRDTLLFSLASSFCTLLIAIPAAYAFAYVAMPWKKVSTLYLLSASAIPGWAIAAPIFLYIRKLGLFDTYAAIIYVDTGYLLPFCTWMLLSFFVNIPKQLAEAALIDGCNKLQTIVRVIVPLAAPGISAMFVFCFLTAWGDFGWPLILTATMVKSIMVVIAAGLTQSGMDYGMICAQGVLSLALPVILAVGSQKFLVKGLVAGAIKG